MGFQSTCLHLHFVAVLQLEEAEYREDHLPVLLHLRETEYHVDLHLTDVLQLREAEYCQQTHRIHLLVVLHAVIQNPK